MNIIPHIDLDTLADSFLEDVLAKENFGASSAKGGFLTGGNVLVCESKGLQWYLQKKCVDKHGIWTALPFKPLAGLLMQCAYNLSSKERKKDEKENAFNASNLVWAIYRLLEGEEKTFYFANELASLFSAYQIYRPDLIETWNKNEPYEIQNADANFKKNEKWQRELWGKLKAEYKNELDISQLYKSIENSLKNPKSEKKFLPKRVFIFAPLSIAPVHLKTLTLLAKADCKVNLYLLQISEEYIGDAKSEKSIAYLRKKSWAENKIVDKENLYWDLGNRLTANLGRSAQILYEQIGWENLEPPVCEPKNANSLLKKIQEDIICDNNSQVSIANSNSITLNNCFSPLREIEILCDYILDLFVEQKLSPADIAVVSPNIETYASAVEMVFGRHKIPYKIADRDVKKYDKTAQLLNLLFSLIGSRYEAPDVVALFEYAMFVQGKELAPNERESLEKYVRENAIRHGLDSSGLLPNYSFKSGFDQLAAGFFMISENALSEKGEYCYPDIEGGSAKILGSFVDFVNVLEKIEEGSKKENSIEDWDSFLKENLQMFFGSDETDFNEDDNPYQKVIGMWDSLKQEMRIGFGDSAFMGFSVLKEALLGKITANAKSSYSLNGEISFSNIETARAVPHRVICCIGMNGGEFPRQNKSKEISLVDAKPRPGDKDRANEDRLMFLETVCSAKERLYISWIGQSEKTAEDIEPSGAVVMLLENLKEQYGLDEKNIVTKHPLQPFSKKYFNSTVLSTYDNRWQPSGNRLPSSGLNRVWEWEVDYVEVEEKRDIDTLYRILADAPRYFLRDVCNIELPEEVKLLENIEPLIVESALDKWQLMKWVLDGEEGEKIKIEKLRGELPNGKFADRIMEKIIEDAKELRSKAENENLKYLIYPGKDKGKYRLKHWLFHLELNLKEENQDTIIFLMDKTIKLSGISKKKAGEILDELWGLKRKLEKRMQPIFPDAAWEYANSKKLEKAWEKLNLHSQYAKTIIGNAETFKDLGIEEKFMECSEILFGEYIFAI